MVSGGGRLLLAGTLQVLIAACAPELVGFANKLETKLEAATVFEFGVESGGIYEAHGNCLDCNSVATFLY